MSRYGWHFKVVLALALALVGLGSSLVFAYLLQDDSEASTLAAEPPPARKSDVETERRGETFLRVVVIDEQAGRQVLQTNATTVAGALQQAGISLTPKDRVEPEPHVPLSAGMEIEVQRARTLTVKVDGELIQMLSNHTDVRAVLAETGITLGPLDTTRPNPDTPLNSGDVLEVIRVTEEFEYEDEPIPYESQWVPTDQLELDTTALLQNGQPGILRRRFRLRYENGVPVERTFDGEWVEQEPQPELLGYGTQIVVRVLETPEGSYEYWRRVEMRVTAYTAASSGKAPDHPAYGITASGLQAGTGIVAVDRRVVPFRSWVYVPGYGVGFAGDTGGGVRGRWIDLGYDEAEYRGWSGTVEVYYLTPVPDAAQINYRLPATLP